MQYTNAQILAAILDKWAQPLVQQIAGQKLSSMPFMTAIENKVKSTGWVPPAWSLAAEIAPIMQPLASSLVLPMLETYLSKIPDAAIPQMAHSVVDAAIGNGGMILMDGNITFDKSDMEHLKKLLDYNLPAQTVQHYAVKTSE